MAYFVALDGGGTKTECWVADETRVLGRATAGTVKLMSIDEGTATARLLALVRAAAAAAEAPVEAVAKVCFGLAGSSGAQVREWAFRTLQEASPAADIVLVGDEETAFEAAFRGGAGILVIAGTGMNVMGRCADGQRFSAGGFGPMLGDEGSGYWIGLEALRAGLRAEERGFATTVVKEAERFWGLKDRAELVAFAHGRVRPAFGDLAVVVARCAESGDSLAQHVLRRAGEELAESVGVVAGRMRAAGSVAGDALRVAFTGSVLGRIAPVWQAMAAALEVRWPGVLVDTDAVQPLEGALWLARGRRSPGKL